MNQVLPASTPIPLETTDYPLPSPENDSHAHHSSFAGGVDQLRRDASLSQSAKGGFLSLSTQYIPNRPPAHEAQFQPGVGISDSSPGSISTSPSSNASSLATYSPFTTPSAYHQPTQAAFGAPAHYPNGGQLFTTSPGFSHPFHVMSGLRARESSITDSSTATGMLPPTRSPGIGNPVSPSYGGTARGNYTTSTPHLSRHTAIQPPRSHDDPLGRVQFSSLPDTTPRALHTATMSLSPSSGPHYNPVSSVLGYQPHAERHQESPPFSELQVLVEMTCDNQHVQPHIDAKIEKGFFYSTDRTWTCYRRNYFSVACSYSLNPHVPNGRLYVNRGGKHQPEQVQALAVSLSAVVDGHAGKIIELVQHTPKRDKGPQMQIGKEKIAPTPPGKSQAEHSYAMGGYHNPSTVASPYLPFQAEQDPSTIHPGFPPAPHNTTTYQHTFERIQFKSATANNGKRRAQQQYYHLIVELWADVRNARDTSANWIKVAQRMSAAVVVRGRSPSHYQNEGPHSSSSSRGGAGGAGGGGTGHLGLGGASAAGLPGRGLGGLSMLGGGGLGGAGVYRGGQYSLDPSPAGSHSVSSASPISAAPVEHMVPEANAMDEGDPKAMNGYEGYQYFPAPIYEAGLLPPVKAEHTLDEARRVKEEYPAAGFAAPYHAGGCGRFQGVESSRGYYPDLPAGY